MKPLEIWASLHQLLVGAATTIQLLATDAMGSAYHGQAKLCCNMLKQAPAVHQELLLGPTLTPQSVDAMQATEALKTAPLVVKVVAQPPPKPKSSKPPSAVALSKLSSVAQQPSTQASSFKQKDKLSSSMISASGKLQSFQGQQSQKQVSFSSHKSFSCHSFHKGERQH